MGTDVFVRGMRGIRRITAGLLFLDERSAIGYPGEGNGVYKDAAKKRDRGRRAMIPVNYWAVLVAALFTFVLGFLWHGPLFGRTWLRLVALTPESMKPGPLHFVVWIGSALLMSFGLANVLATANPTRI